jgi:hypothetical protein
MNNLIYTTDLYLFSYRLVCRIDIPRTLKAVTMFLNSKSHNIEGCEGGHGGDEEIQGDAQADIRDLDRSVKRPKVVSLL